MNGKKIDMLIWVKGIEEEHEGDVLKDATTLKKYTDDIVVVAGPPEKLLSAEARRGLIAQPENTEGQNIYTDDQNDLVSTSVILDFDGDEEDDE